MRRGSGMIWAICNPVDLIWRGRICAHLTPGSERQLKISMKPYQSFRWTYGVDYMLALRSWDSKFESGGYWPDNWSLYCLYCMLLSSMGDIRSTGTGYEFLADGGRAMAEWASMATDGDTISRDTGLEFPGDGGGGGMTDSASVTVVILTKSVRFLCPLFDESSAFFVPKFVKSIGVMKGWTSQDGCIRLVIVVGGKGRKSVTRKVRPVVIVI